jgi:hypothetical protein
MLDMEVIVRRQDQEHCASITCMIRHYVARRAQVIEDHPHNAAMRYVRRQSVDLSASRGRTCLAVRALRTALVATPGRGARGSRSRSAGAL